MNLAQIPTETPKWWESIPAEWRPYLWYVAAGLIGLLILRAIWQRLMRALRRRRPATIHPLLQKYNVDHAELDRKRREQAVGIVASSTGNRLAGYRIVRQVEAVFVDGYRSPEDAMIALKAAAAERGANALLNVRTERTAAGRCSASGDAIIAAAIALRPTSSPSVPPGKPPPPSSEKQSP